MPWPNGKAARHLDREQSGYDVRLAFAEAYRFYDRPGERDPAGPEASRRARGAEPRLPRVRLVSCGDYPELLRALRPSPGRPARPPRPDARGPGTHARRRRTARPWFEPEESPRPWTRYQLRERALRPGAARQGGRPTWSTGCSRLERKELFVAQPARRRRQRAGDGRLRRKPPARQRLSPLAGRARSMTEDASSLPALKTGGFTIALCPDARGEEDRRWARRGGEGRSGARRGDAG